MGGYGSPGASSLLCGRRGIAVGPEDMNSTGVRHEKGEPPPSVIARLRNFAPATSGRKATRGNRPRAVIPITMPMEPIAKKSAPSFVIMSRRVTSHPTSTEIRPVIPTKSAIPGASKDLIDFLSPDRASLRPFMVVEDWLPPRTRRAMIHDPMWPSIHAHRMNPSTNP